MKKARLTVRRGARKDSPRIEDYATVEAFCDNVPVYAFGYTYVHAVSPTFLPAVAWQDGAAAAKKIKPKKSWEIRGNLCGSTPAREPKLAANDDQPLLCAHLIDGDPETCWCSRGQTQPDVEDVWIRIDLPKVSRVCQVSLLPHPKGLRGFTPWPPDGVSVGQAWPTNLTVKVSQDGWHWENVYETVQLEPRESGRRLDVRFDARAVKQVWIIGRGFPRVMNFGHCFSIASVEVIEETGENLALHSRGAGVTVSSTHYGYGMDRFTQDMLWPLQYDLGFKWSRVGYDMGMFTWAYVEREKGRLRVDPKADAAVTEATENGIEVVMVLDKGNWLYAPQPRTPNRTRELVENYYNNPPQPHTDPGHFKGWLNYVRFMVNHFKDRVRYFEVGNEWPPNTREGAMEYAKLAKPTIALIRKLHPKARLIAASPGTFGLALDFIEGYLEAGLGPLIDVIAWHPFYQFNPEDEKYRNYPEQVRQFKKKAAVSYGFKGEYMATEWTWSAPYPPASDQPFQVSEMQKAKYAARLMMTHAALRVVSFWNETFQTQFARWDVSLLRNTFSADPISPTQPQPVYYVLRTLSTVLDNARPAPLEFAVSGCKEQVEQYSFKRGRKEVLLALWLPGTAAEDEGRTVAADVMLPEGGWKSATAYDVLNGAEQALRVTRSGRRTMLQQVRIRDWPMVISLK